MARRGGDMNKNIYRLDGNFKLELKSDGLDALKYVQQEIEILSYLYPDIKNWYKNVFSKSFLQQERKILLVKDIDDELAAFVLLKDTFLEKKICTFYVCPTFREARIGKKLLPISVDLLGGKNVGITVSQEVNSSLKMLLESNSFSVHDIKQGLYLPNKSEFCYKL